MEAIIWIVLGCAAYFGIGAFLFSDKGSPKDRAEEAAGAAAGGAMFGMTFLFILFLPAIPIAIAILIYHWITK
jgi:hypothetical protein